MLLTILVLLLYSQPSVGGGCSFAVTVRNSAGGLVAKSHSLVNRGRVLGDVYWFEEVSSLGKRELSQQLLEEDVDPRVSEGCNLFLHVGDQHSDIIHLKALHWRSKDSSIVVYTLSTT